MLEILTVIAIISALSALMFPVCAQIKRKAMQTTTISNAKQLISSNQMYSTDFDSVMCPYFSGYDPISHSYTTPQKYWPELVSVYIAPVVGHGNLGQALAEDLPAVFFDPIKPFKKQATYSFKFGIISSWGVSDDLVDWFGPDATQPTKRPSSEMEVSEPTQCVHLVETRDWLLGAGFPGNALCLSYFDQSGRGAITSVDAPHGVRSSSEFDGDVDPQGKNITAFVDGHVRLVVASKLFDSGELWSKTATNKWP